MAGTMTSPYTPPRQTAPADAGGDPLELSLVFNVRPCGTCSFFWPADPATQPYGPYSTFDFTTNTPQEAPPPPDAASFPWLTGVTGPAGFPDAEIMDGCRKAPIMTLGINPNLTAFAPGQTGASWCYPSFSSDDRTNSWEKYAYYYRYRSVFQERFSLDFAKQFLIPGSEIIATKSGRVASARRPNDAPRYSIEVLYDGDTGPTRIDLPGALGSPPYVVLFDDLPPNDRFTAGETIAAQIAVPAGRPTQVYEQQIGYYERIVPILDLFADFLQTKGHSNATLRVGEDVCQLDMVACASPHWAPAWLGGSEESERTIIANCVAKNGWALKQLIQTRPVVLLLVGEATFEMFRDAFGRYIQAATPLPAEPADGAFTLLAATVNLNKPVTLKLAETVSGYDYQLSTRIIVTPHFSYPENFLPQYRFSLAAWTRFQSSFADCATFLQSDRRIAPSSSLTEGYKILILAEEAQAVQTQIAQTWPNAAASLQDSFYDVNAMIEAVFQQLYTAGSLTYVDATKSTTGHLTRAVDNCSFCVNRHWTFPLGCPYGKLPDPGAQILPLDQVASQLLATSARRAAFRSAHILDDGFEAARQPFPTK